jgi:hypothetical protein
MALNVEELASSMHSKIVSALGTDIPKDAAQADSEWYKVSKAISEAIINHIWTKAQLFVPIPPLALLSTPAAPGSPVSSPAPEGYVIPSDQTKIM